MVPISFIAFSFDEREKVPQRLAGGKPIREKGIVSFAEKTEGN